jgi:membrane protease YdiL (CAAX protease family)
MLPAMPSARKPSNYSLLFTYVLPYFLYVGALSVPAEVLARPWAYALATAASGAALAWGWRWYVPLRGPRPPLASVAAGLAAGVAGTALWVALKEPFYAADGAAWTPAAFWARVVASGSVVAVFEELLFRGLILRGAVEWDAARRAGSRDPLGQALHDSSPLDVAPGAWTPSALAVSSIAFAAGHLPGEWPAALAYGLLMAGLWVWRGDLLSCVVAHGTTNVTLALWVRHTGAWSLW